ETPPPFTGPPDGNTGTLSAFPPGQGQAISGSCGSSVAARGAGARPGRCPGAGQGLVPGVSRPDSWARTTSWARSRAWSLVMARFAGGLAVAVLQTSWRAIASLHRAWLARTTASPSQPEAVPD